MINYIAKKEDLETAFYIRKKVFVEEQGVPLQDEFDEHEEHAEHVLVYDQGKAVGTGRLRIVNGVGKLERICLLPSHRKYGLGKVIIQALEEMARKKGVTTLKLHSQTHAEAFYKKSGYKKSSEIFMEDGIPHILMIKDLV